MIVLPLCVKIILSASCLFYLMQSHFRYLFLAKSAHSTYVLSSPPRFCTYYGNNSLYSNDKSLFHPVMSLVLIAFITVIILRVLFLTHLLRQLLHLVTGSITHLLLSQHISLQIIITVIILNVHHICRLLR